MGKAARMMPRPKGVTLRNHAWRRLVNVGAESALRAPIARIGMTSARRGAGLCIHEFKIAQRHCVTDRGPPRDLFGVVQIDLDLITSYLSASCASITTSTEKERTDSHHDDTQNRRERHTAARWEDCNYYRYDPRIHLIRARMALILPR